MLRLKKPRKSKAEPFYYHRAKTAEATNSPPLPVGPALNLRRMARNPTVDHKPKCSHVIKQIARCRSNARKMFHYLVHLDHETAINRTVQLRARAAAGYFVFARVLFGVLRAQNVDVHAALRRKFGDQMPRVAVLLNPAPQPNSTVNEVGAQKEELKRK